MSITALDVPTQVKKIIEQLEAIDKGYFAKDRIK
jgi:hypothetical protein